MLVAFSEIIGRIVVGAREGGSKVVALLTRVICARCLRVRVSLENTSELRSEIHSELLTIHIVADIHTLTECGAQMPHLKQVG